MNKDFDKIHQIETSKPRKSEKYELLRPYVEPKRPNQLLEIPVRSIPYLLNICEPGDGASYQDFAFIALIRIFEGIINIDLARQNIPIKGGIADIELPFNYESIFPDHPHWMVFQRDFNIRAILAEAKNLKGKAEYQHANQLKGYVDAHKRGKLAFLISRNGFTTEALTALQSYCYEGYLILPLENYDLQELIKLSLDHPAKVTRYLRRKEELLIRMSLS